MKKIGLAIIEILLLCGICTAAGWDWGKPMPQMPTPGGPAPQVQYNPGASSFGYPSPYYASPQPIQSKPFDSYSPYYYSPYPYYFGYRCYR